MAITIENATVTATINSVEYVHAFVTNITIADPLQNMLTVSPQGTGKGIVYRTGTTSPVVTSLTVRDLAVALKNLYKNAFKDQSRVDLMIVDTATQERYDFDDSIIQDNPVNSTISEGETSLDVAIIFQTPPSSFDHTEEEE